MKRNLARLYNEDRVPDYTDAKTDFIRAVEARALTALGS
jgi:hypothetical protein